VVILVNGRFFRLLCRSNAPLYSGVLPFSRSKDDNLEESFFDSCVVFLDVKLKLPNTRKKPKQIVHVKPDRSKIKFDSFYYCCRNLIIIIIIIIIKDLCFHEFS